MLVRLRAGRGVVDLEGQVGDAVLAGQHRLQVGADGVTVLVGLDQHVGRGGGHAGRDLPDVQVMHLGDVTPGRHLGAQGRRVEVGRRRLQEDAPRFADQPAARPQHERDHHQGGDRVGAGEPGDQDEDGGVAVAANAYRSVSTWAAAPSMLRLRRPRPPVRPGQQPARRQVDADPGQRHAEHQRAGHRVGGDQPADRLVGQPDRQQHQRDAVGLGGEDLQAAQPVGVPAAGRPPGDPGRDDRQADGGGIGDHVRRVGQQRERVRRHPGHDLARHERHDERRGRRQPPGVGVRGGAVCVTVLLVPVFRRLIDPLTCTAARYATSIFTPWPGW